MSFLSSLLTGGIGTPKGGMRDFLWGTPGKTEKLPTMDPQQQQFFQNYLKQLEPGGQAAQGYGQSMSYLTDLLNPESDVYKGFEAPYMTQFEQEIVPGIAERFAGAGGGMGGGLSSSGFGQALGGGAAELQSNLAGMKSSLMQQAMQSLMGQYQGMAGQALGTQPFGYQYQAPSQGLIQQLAAGAAKAGTSAAMGGF